MSLPFEKGDIVYFLGDIFDLLIGPHSEYYDIYDWYFLMLKKIIKAGVKVHYFEGNHDFHIEKLLQVLGVIVHKGPVVHRYLDLNILFCHGDEIELGNPTYKIYKAFIQSRALNIIANYLMPFKVQNLIGENASKKSRQKNKNRYGDPQENFKIRDSFRIAAVKAQKKYAVEVVICGHSHFQDDHKWKDGRYLNCGYLPITKNYIVIDKDIHFENL